MEEEKALLHFKDLSFLRGYGVFDFFRLRGNQPLFLEDHLQRFYYSAGAMHLPVPFDDPQLKDIISGLIQKNDWPDAGIRLSLTGGYSEDGFNIGKPNLLISQHTFPSPTKDQQRNGIHLLSHSHQRQLPQVKTIDYLTAIWLQPLRKQKGADDILYHHNGFVTECPRSNFFLVTKDETIITPLENVLAGITAKKLMEVAGKEFRVEQRPVRLEEIGEAKEVFITSTTKQILPVSRIDDVTFAQHTVSQHLLEVFRLAYGC